MEIELKELAVRKLDKEDERKGNKLIKWSPFPNPPKNYYDFSKMDSASVRMSLFRIYPVSILLILNRVTLVLSRLLTSTQRKL
jgi:hypothetical protein